MVGGVCERYAGNSVVTRLPENELLTVCILDFRRRFLSLLSYKFREFGSVMALSIIEAANNGLKALDKNAKRGNVISPLQSFITR